MDYEGLGRRVRRARNSADMTQSELAEKLGISTSFLGHIERGSRKASLETVIRIANELGVSLDILLADSLTDNHGFSNMVSYTHKQRLVMQEVMQTLADNLDAFIDEKK